MPGPEEVSYCGKELIEHLQEVAWPFFIILMLLFGLALIFGSFVEYKAALWVCLTFAMLVAAVFAVIILGSLLCIGVTAFIQAFIEPVVQVKRLGARWRLA